MVTFVIGGARSGKSGFALERASACPGRKAYIATAQALDGEMMERIEDHMAQRGPEWDTYEEPIEIAEILKRINGKYSAVIIDCLTLWLSNLILRSQDTEYRRRTFEVGTEKLMKALSDVKGTGGHLFIVSNEVGMGVVPENELARRFRDFAGTLNRKVAEAADEVYIVAAGIPLRIKYKC